MCMHASGGRKSPWAGTHEWACRSAGMAPAQCQHAHIISLLLRTRHHGHGDGVYADAPLSQGVGVEQGSLQGMAVGHLNLGI